jgi:hypothetical protein
MADHESPDVSPSGFSAAARRKGSGKCHIGATGGKALDADGSETEAALKFILG